MSSQFRQRFQRIWDRILQPVWVFLGSYALAISVLLLLLVLTYFGTIAQIHMSIHDAQMKYFDSMFVRVETPIGIPALLPGGRLLLILLTINLIVGGMVRIRRSSSKIGIYVIHAGILILLIGSYFEDVGSEKGYMTLVEGERKDYFHSGSDWEVVIHMAVNDGEEERDFVVPFEQLEPLAEGGSLNVSHPELPFTVRLSDFLLNSKPQRGPDRRMPVVLQELPRDADEVQANAAGISALVVDGHGTRRETVLWGRSLHPWVFKADGRDWGMTLRKRTWMLPYSVQLRDAEGTEHPGTSIPSRYWSDVRRYEGNTATDVHIKMNHPMREEGYTFYQTGFQRAGGGTGKDISTFSVVKNPTDRVPLYACIVIAIGLVIHFATKLERYMRAENKKRELAGHATSTA
ncbi:MAG: cytochrome c biogenesis protein ResB [Planctomycetota bacterium]